MSNPAEPPAATILTLGCKLNIADSEAIALDLRRAGWRVTEQLSPDSDAVIVNSCSVTHVADRKSRHLLSQAKRLAPKATLAFTGCMVETVQRSAIEALGADLVYRQVEQRVMAQRLIEAQAAGAFTPSASLRAGLTLSRGERESEPAQRDAPINPGLRTRAFISAQEGCNDVCAFCIIPRTRGRERSKPVEAVVQEARAREAEGAREIVITGTQLGAYGREAGERTLHSVIEAVLDETTVPRIRISSVQPQDLSPRLIDLWKNPRLCRHFHLALQSGSETVLGRMRRRYTKAQYAAAVDDLRRRIPGVAITTDVIAGFPGETDAEFDESYDFCRSMRFAAMHVFPYSNRKGTGAEKLPSQVGEQVKKGRVRRLIALGDDLSREFRSTALGAEVEVLWETQSEEGVWEGLTDTYVRVRARSDRHLYNQLASARIVGLGNGGLTGEMVS